MVTNKKSLSGWLGFLILIVAVAGCRKSEDGADSIPDLNRQSRAFVTVESTRVRTGPGSEFRVIGEIKPNSRVNVVGKDGDWLLIVSKKGNAPGFIEIASVKPGTGQEQESPAASVEGKYEVLKETQVRSGPGLHYPVVAKLPKGITINVVGEENGWFKVESKRGNQPGYVETTLARPKAGQ